MHQDHTASNEFRVYVRHLSATSMENYADVIQLCLTYIWENIYCQNIRIELLHLLQENGRFQAEPEIKKLFASQGFKWKTLSNDPVTGLRAQVMQLNRFATTPAFQNPQGVMENQEPLTVKTGVILGLGQESTGAPETCDAEAVGCRLACLQALKKN